MVSLFLLISPIRQSDAITAGYQRGLPIVPLPPHFLYCLAHFTRPSICSIDFSTFGMSTRSYHGCWTCKRRRRRCDNARPTCRNCAQRGVDCEGYEVRLRWGSGIASRGRFTGADKPLEENIPPRPKGRRRDLSKERKRLEAQAQAQTDNGQFKIPVMIYDRIDESLVEFHDMVTQLEDDVSPKTDRSEQDEILFNECKFKMKQNKMVSRYTKYANYKF